MVRKSFVSKLKKTRLREMDLTNYRTMDPHLLVGLVNTELRNNAEDLDDLCKTHNLTQDSLRDKLMEEGYHYREDQKQFR